MRRRALPPMIGALMAIALGFLVPLSSSAANPPVVVEITGSGFSPSALTIPPHTTVTWVNRDSEAHSVSGDPGTPLDSPLLEPRFSYSYTFHNPGTFAYHDSANAALAGAISVVEGAPVPAPPPDSPSPAPIPEGPSTSADSGDQTGVGGALPAGSAQPVPPDSSTSQGSSAGGSYAGTPQSALLASAAVSMGNEWFGDPSFQGGVFESTISQGGTVEWAVQDGLHNVYECGENWGEASSSCGAADWHSDQVITAGATYSYTFDSAGTFYYLCTIHPATMRGIVNVEATGGAVQDPTPTPAAEEDPPTTEDPASEPSQDPAPTIVQAAGVPQGGGFPGTGGDGRTIAVLIGAIAAFLISTVAFFVGGGVRIRIR